MRRVLRVGLVLSLGMVVGVSTPAAAACHAFTVSVDPTEVEEGDAVTVTVERDAAVAPSSIDVSTVDGTATAGTDYEPLDETADFPDGGTSQTFTVQTLTVDGDSGSRTFQVELDNPQGCDVQPNYTVGDPATVTITDAAAQDTEEPTEEPADQPTVADDATEAADEELPETGSDVPLGLVVLALLTVLAGAVLLRRHPAGG